MNLSKCWLWLFSAIATAVFFAGCDHTKLTGTIESSSDALMVNQEVALTLTVPKELDGIYRVFWEVIPLDAATVRYAECQEKQCVPEAGFTADRTAYLNPLRSGKITVRVFGFYKQTNPQPICERSFTVKE